MITGGIFGPKLSGKTTLARELSRNYWRKAGLRSLVLNLHCETFGPQAYVTADEAAFWPIVWKTRACLIIVDDASATVRRERELIPVFTRLRHCNHRLLVIGHSGVDLLPTMRHQLDTLYLFRQCESAARQWADDFTQPALLEAVNLGQFEFLFAEMYRDCRRLRLSLPSA